MIEETKKTQLPMVKKPVHKKKWDWLPCIYDFKQGYDGKEIIWNFSPYVLLSAEAFNVSNLLQDLRRRSWVWIFSLKLALWPKFGLFQACMLTRVVEWNRPQCQYRDGQDVHPRWEARLELAQKLEYSIDQCHANSKCPFSPRYLCSLYTSYAFK
jgi:hypothetical protein